MHCHIWLLNTNYKCVTTTLHSPLFIEYYWLMDKCSTMELYDDANVKNADAADDAGTKSDKNTMDNLSLDKRGR